MSTTSSTSFKKRVYTIHSNFSLVILISTVVFSHSAINQSTLTDY